MVSPSNAPGPVASQHPAEDPPLRIEGFKGTPEEIERQWFEEVYKGRGDTLKQLTWRAVLMGTALGGVLSLTNLYIGLKAGWAFGVAITASILSYAIWTTLVKVGISKEPMSILENNCMQSTASAAGYSTGTTLVSAFSAYFLINNHSLPVPLMLGWVFCLALLGVTMAVPMKRQMVNIEQLRFPSGIAAAETLRALHSKSSQGMESAKALGIAGVAAAISQFWMDGLGLVSAKLAPFALGGYITKLNLAVFGKAWMTRTVMLVWDPIFIAAGALSGFRVTLSMFIGGTLCWVVYVPILQHGGYITGTSYREIVQWPLWGGVACMVSSGMLMFFMQWRTVVRALSGLGAIFGRKSGGKNDDMEAIETPAWWFAAGQLVSLVALSWLAKVSFDMPVWQSVVAVGLSFFLALVACRVTGETDTTPTGPMGKVTQLTFGVLNPGNINVNLMSASITSGSAIASADLLTDLKSGYLLGANPRKQFIAQFAGIFIGTVATVLAYQVLVPTAASLGSDQFPAPAAQTWRAVAEALSQGLGNLHPIKVWSIAIGGAIGIILPLLSKAFPKQQKYILSPAGLGLSWTFHWYYGALFVLGGLIGLIFEKKWPKRCEQYLFPVASGVIAGGSLMGVLLIFVENGPEMLRKLFGG